jgi:HEAT repeat protein
LSLGATGTDLSPASSFRVSATLETVVLSDVDGYLELGHRLTDIVLDVKAQAPVPAEETARLRGGLELPFGSSVDPEGRAVAVILSPEAHPMARGLLRMLVASTQLVAPPAPGDAVWKTTETDPLGEYRAEYRRVGENQLTKSKLEYPQPAGAASRPEVSLDNSVLRATTDSHGLVELQHNERVSIGFGDAGTVAQSAWSLHLVRKSAAPRARAAALRATLAGFEAVALAGPETVPAGDAANHDAQLAGGASVPELVSAIDRAALDVQAASTRAQLLVKLSARLRLEPARAAEVGALLRDADRDPEAASVLVGALEAAATPEARAELLALASQTDAPLDVRENAIAALGSAPTTPQSTAALQKLGADESPEVRSSALLALGAAAKQGSADALQSVIEAAGSAVGEQETVDALLALGNAGAPEGLGAIEAALSHPTPAVRRAAVEALRFVPGAEADRLIATVLQGDTSEGVRLGAVMAAAYREAPATLGLLAASALTDPGSAVRAACLAELARKVSVHPEWIQTIEAAHAQDPDPEVRTLAAGLLTSLGQAPAAP